MWNRRPRGLVSSPLYSSPSFLLSPTRLSSYCSLYHVLLSSLSHSCSHFLSFLLAFLPLLFVILNFLYPLPPTIHLSLGFSLFHYLSPLLLSSLSLSLHYEEEDLSSKELTICEGTCHLLEVDGIEEEETNGYNVAYKPITLSCISFMFIEMKFIHYYSCVMFTMKSMSICND